MMKYRVSLSVALLLAVSGSAPAPSRAELSPRQPLRGVRVAEPAAVRKHSFQANRLVVKFVDDARIRLRSGVLVSETDRDLSRVEEIVGPSEIEPLVRMGEVELSALEARAAARSGREQPDLAALMIVNVPDRSRVEIGRRLAALPIVEFAYIQSIGIPPPGDIAPPTPDHDIEQGYRGPDPGVDADYANALGYDGSGIQLSDCEYAWVDQHEDLIDVGIVTEPGQSIPDWVIAFGFDEHGTAVLGETSAPDNGYGVHGMASGASVRTYPEWSVEEGSRRVTSIVQAIAGSAPGDVVLLEMQDSAFAPAEVDPAVWSAVKVGTDAGVVVVAAAGNGNQDLDAPFYDEYRSRGDSGAILVGAGSADANHDKLSFSTFGDRVDVHGWGEGVFSVGYGDFAEYGGDKNQRYTSIFGGTSSASPFVASAALIAQQAAVEQAGIRLSSIQIRDLLRATGIPQGSGDPIGPFVNIRQALDQVLTEPAIGLDGSCPGSVTLDLRDLTAGGGVALLWSDTAGSGRLASGPCAGVATGLESPRLLERLRADSAGEASFRAEATEARCGAQLQAIDLTTCRTSAVAALP